MSWMLITVTGDGVMSTTTFDTERSCRQAESVAMTGLTLEENEAADREYADRIERARKAWREKILAAAHIARDRCPERGR